MNVLPLLAVLSLGTATSSASWTTNPSLRFQPALQIAQSGRAEAICTSEVRDRGLRVVNILETNDHSGGTEVIMRVTRSGNDYTVGCDYSASSRNVELYRIEDGRRDRDDRFESDDDDSDDRFYRGDRNRSDRVSDRQDAENIAREAVGDQLDIDDPYSDIVEIDDIERNNQTWIVEGEANGAPFRVRIRSNDASIEDFQLY
ncbi:MAG: hypothetical protein KME11_06550 [Timaviella obliquedivisa GSE-PSE-MK23-08B]|jgi:hypothetical protein|nr:hypothetical protein [Timaviella obliquedivisa GSE-PSE-MK23-08B]